LIQKLVTSLKYAIQCYSNTRISNYLFYPAFPWKTIYLKTTKFWVFHSKTQSQSALQIHALFVIRFVFTCFHFSLNSPPTQADEPSVFH
jgi:hypothetical protein